MSTPKTFLAAVALVLATSLSFGVAGCSGSGTTSAEKMESQVVSEKTWNKFFSSWSYEYDGENIEGVTIDATITDEHRYYEDGVLVDMTSVEEYEVVIAGDKDYVVSGISREGRRGSVFIDDSDPLTLIYSETVTAGNVPVCYEYTQNAAHKWEKNVAEQSLAREKYTEYMSIITETDYDMYTYDEDVHGYIFKDDMKGEGPVIKFRNGELAGIYLQTKDYENGSQIITYDIVVSYGEREVNLPAEFTDNTPQAE